ncbi:MAG: TSUP family transporter [Solirubrobacteraceae bacterium]
MLLYLRQRQRLPQAAPSPAASAEAMPAARVVLPLGLAVALVSGLFGLGGQLLSVPLLISIGAPMLPALGAAQAQSIVIVGVGTLGYALRGAIAWPLVLVVGVPLLAGALAGWWVAHAVPTERLRSVLAVVLIAVGAYLIVHNG